MRKITAILLTVSLLFSFAVIFASADAPELGDVNNDGKIAASDARLTLRASAKLETLTDKQLKAADIDFNGRVSAADARTILRVSAKLESFKTADTETTTTAEEETTTKVNETTTTAPETTTSVPETTTEAEPEVPETTTIDPETTTVPETTTSVPETTTDAEQEVTETTTIAPETTTSVPEITTEAELPETTTIAPETTTSVPEITTDAEVPETTTIAPETTTVPETTTSVPETTTEAEPEVPEVHVCDFVAVMTLVPTCTDNGAMTYTCSCGKSYDYIIAATGHNGIWNTVIPATDNTNGLRQFTCTICSKLLDEEIIPALKEEFSEEISTEETTDLPYIDEDEVIDTYPAAIDAFFSGNFYLNGSMTDGKTSTPIKMATGKSQTEIAIDMPDSDLELSIYAKGKETYLKLSSGDKKHYVELTDILKDEMNIDFSEIMGQLTSIKFNDAGKPILTHGIYNGKECDIYTFANEEGTAIRFYAIDEKVVQLTLADAESVESSIAITELTSKIPSNMLTLKGYTKASILTLPLLYPEFGGNS